MSWVGVYAAVTGVPAPSSSAGRRDRAWVLLIPELNYFPTHACGKSGTHAYLYPIVINWALKV